MLVTCTPNRQVERGHRALKRKPLHEDHPEEGQTPREAGMRCRLQKRGHALRQQIARGIRDEEIRDVIVHGTLRRVREVSTDGVRYRWDSSNRLLRVCYYLRPCLILVKTVMYR